LDLGGWNDHVAEYTEPPTVLDDLLALAQIDGEFDTIVSLVRTPLVADMDSFIADLVSHLAPDGIVAFLEPTLRPGRTGAVLRLGARAQRAFGGLHLDRDIPNEFRQRRLFVTDLHRFQVASVAAPFRPFVDGRARRNRHTWV
jgi:2-polyprenyl-3-methyl-5-hydroxy-6-metoxy-1,4-benzoquinol methylase